MDDKVVPTVSRTELTAIIRRLEAATSRLEDMASATIEVPKTNGAAPAPAPTGPLPTPPVIRTPPTPKAVQEVLPELVEDFDAFVTGTVKKYVNLSDEIGGAVAEQVWSFWHTNPGVSADHMYRHLMSTVHLLASASSSSLRRKRRSLKWATISCNS
jgi:adenylyl cyclase-associated protein